MGAGDRGYPFVILYGHESYYPRFGFRRASTLGLQPQWEEVPDAAFMALILDERAMDGVRLRHLATCRRW